MADAASRKAHADPFGGDALAAEIAALMRRGVAAPLEDAEFDRLSRRVFEAQYAASPRLRAYWDRRGCTPHRIAHWSEIAAIPAAAFRDSDLSSDESPPARVFHTSGTTGARPGRHALSARGLALYQASMLPTFRHFLMPELEEAAEAARSSLMPIAVHPPSRSVPHSSLAFMVDGVCRDLCASPTVHVMSETGLDGVALRAALAAAERDGRPVLLLGSALALVAAADSLSAQGEEFFLPSGSRAMETGGTKRAEATSGPATVRTRIADAFGVAESHVVGEYGMTELCSQFYEPALREAWQDAHSGCEWRDEGADASESSRDKHGPPWVRAIVCDPETLAPLPAGRAGVLRFVDLANRFSVSFLQTEDLAVAADEGAHGPGSAPFALLGRASGAEARGCSLAAEEWLRAAGAR